MFEALLSGIQQVFIWPSIGYLMLGVLIGMWSGCIPGLGGIVSLVIVLPFTFGMDPVPAFALLLGVWTVTSTSDTIISVMLGIPGTTASQATIMDGYPLARKGQASRALGAAFTVSAIGGVVGALILAISLPMVKPLIMAFGSPELFMLGILGLTAVGMLAGKSLYKGLAAAALGILLSTVGMAETVATPRYTFGSLYLMDGIPLIPAVLGLFAIPELLNLAVRNISISSVSQQDAKDVGILRGVKDAIENKWLAVRCSVLGAYIGVLPGLGASIVDWIAYGHAKQSAKDDSQFGRGDIRGVIAPEAANNAIKGGALIPTVAFGIPGSLGTAILLGALIMQGLRPGPNMLTANLDLTYSMVWMIVVANIVAAALLLVWAKQVAKLAFLPSHFIVPGVMGFIFMGAWLTGSTMGDWLVCLSMGVLGYVMKRGGWPRPPLVLALILGSILEASYQISVNAYGGHAWLTRPIVLGILVLIVITVCLAIRSARIKKKKQKSANTQASLEKEDDDDAGEGQGGNAQTSAVLTAILLCIFVWAVIQALAWPAEAKGFPMVAALPAVFLALAAFSQDVREVLDKYRQESTLVFFDSTLIKALSFFGYLASIIVLSYLVGQKIAICLFIIAYLRYWARCDWLTVTTYAMFAWVVLIIFYDKVMGVLFHPSLLGGWIQNQWPQGDWLTWIFF